MTGGRVVAAGVALVVGVAVLVANIGRGDAPPPSAGGGPPTPVAPARAPAVAMPDPAAVQRGLGDIAAAVRPTVVSLSVQPEQLGGPAPAGIQMLYPFQSKNGWVGSGLVVHPAGYVLTSRQVMRDAQQARVTMYHSGGNTFVARRVATDRRIGLVLLRMSTAREQPFARLGDSSRVHTGDMVIALGSPFGLAETVTQGIVSTRERTIMVEGDRLLNVIQTDAAINSGNCGGPLVDIHAQVIGINIAIYSTDSSFSGVGFAVPSNRALGFVNRAVGARR